MRRNFMMANVPAVLSMLRRVHAKSPALLCLAAIVSAKNAAELSLDDDEHAKNSAESMPSRGDAPRVPQWIVDLEQQHKHASRKELSRIMHDMRKRAQREMDRFFK